MPPQEWGILSQGYSENFKPGGDYLHPQDLYC